MNMFIKEIPPFGQPPKSTMMVAPFSSLFLVDKIGMLHAIKKLNSRLFYTHRLLSNLKQSAKII